MGLKGFHVDPFPDERGGLPLWDSAYEPFWSLVEETGLPMSFHIVGQRKVDVRAMFMNPTPGVKENFIALTPMSIAEVISTLVFTGVLARHPKLHFVLVECGIGWIPYFVERMDQTFNKHRFWTKSVITEKPSTYWYRQGHATFIQDLAGVAARHRAGLRNIMWSTDYPHSDSTWPKSREALEEHFRDVPADERALIAGGNAAALYHLN
jgi:predicted TIM-barrel fold metal-dependent hydrolase